jgi:hypothetical protein
MMAGMLNRFSVAVCALVLFTACQPPQKPTGPLACGPNLGTLVVTDVFVSKAITSAGGCKAWLNTIELDLDCVVTFYQPPRFPVEGKSKGSYYLTQQHHEIYPWSNSVRISAMEPQGKFVWLLSQDNFTPAQGQAQYDIRDMIYAVRAIMTAPARFLDEEFEFSKSSEPVKMQGLWYYPIESRGTRDETRKVVFYQNRDTSLVDIILFVGSDENESLLVRGYDYHKVKPTGVLLPTRIEVFAATPAGVVQHRLLKIDYYNL